MSSPISKVPNRAIVRRLEKHGQECAIAAPVWHELTYECRRLRSGKRRSALEIYLQEVVQATFPILPYDETAATWHGHERTRLDALGQPTPYVDGQIAAVARINGLTVVTTNTKNFARFKGLQVENWSEE